MQSRRRALPGFLTIVLGALLLTAGAPAGLGQAPAGPLVLVTAIEGPIGPATVHHVEKVTALAEDREAALLVLRLDTPGGLASSMRKIISEILASPVPVAGYVAPPGAHAASAGTYILYATHVAAMAPGTNLGAATPVQIGGGVPGIPSGDDGKPEKKPGEPADREQPSTPMEAKAVNDAVAFIRSLAQLHGRNAEWAEKAVREAASLAAGEAQRLGVIDLVADDLDALLAGIDGRTIQLGGKPHTLALEGAAVERVEVDTMTRVLGILSNPNVAFVLLMIGIYGLIFEFANPGSIGPGVVGVICLTLGLYALQQLPLDYAGLGLVLFGVALMTAEAITPTFGVLGIGGLVSLVIGAAMLINSEAPAFQLSWWTIAGAAVVSAGTLVFLLGYLWHAYRHPRGPIRTIGDAMVGLDARVVDWSGDAGHVWARGERWQARAAEPLAAGETVRVRSIDGLTLLVEREAASDKPLEGD